MFDLLLLQDFLDTATCEEILGRLRAAASQPAPVYGSGAGAAIEPRVRNARRIDGSPELLELVGRRLVARKAEIEQHFGVALDVYEEPQFLRYEPGDFFVAHQDGNTSLLRDDSSGRRISVVIFLNTAYEGGALTFHGRYPDFEVRQSAIGDPGTLVAFRSETTHEVTPVTGGERYTIVSWYRGDSR
jgi:SM-20-related protein